MDGEMSDVQKESMPRPRLHVHFIFQTRNESVLGMLLRDPEFPVHQTKINNSTRKSK